MIHYGSRKFGLRWDFPIEQNTVVIWHGHRPDWLVADREAIAKLLRRKGSRAAVNQFLATRLEPGSFCWNDKVAERLKFSDI